MSHQDFQSRQIGRTCIIAAIMALVYNSFSVKGLPLIRTQPNKTAVSDSTLFSSTDASHQEAHLDSSRHSEIKVFAPLHERAMRNPDSVRAVVEAKKEARTYKIITLAQLNRLLEQHRGILFDARASDDYQKGHIKGSKNIPGLDPGQHFPELVEIPRDTLLIIYCNNPECHLGRSLIDFLRVMEFTNMVLYDDGWDGWIKAGMPVDSTAVN